MKGKRIKEIDVLYTLGTLLVVLGHSHSSDWSVFEGTILHSIIVFIYVFHMPLFFFIAGILFEYSDSIEKNGFKKWITDKTIRLMVPYIFLSVVALIPKYFIEHNGFSGFNASYLLKVLFVPRIGVWGHFWFLPVLLTCYFLFGFWKVTLKDRKKAVSLGLIFGIGVFSYCIPVKLQWLGISDLKNVIVFFCAGVVFCLWMKTGKEKNSFGFSVLWIIGSILVSFFSVKYFYHSRIATLCVAFVMISACWQFSKLINENRVVSWISRHNFTIYIYSWPFQAVGNLLCEKLTLSWQWTLIIMFIIGITGPTFIVWIYEKTRIFHQKGIKLVLGMK